MNNSQTHIILGNDYRIQLLDAWSKNGYEYKASIKFTLLSALYTQDDD